MELDRLRFELKVVLGSTEMPTSYYNELRAGDILILDQEVAEPLKVFVEKELLYKGRPGLCETKKGIVLV